MTAAFPAPLLPYNRWLRIFSVLFPFILLSGLQTAAQPLLIVGEGGAEVKAAVSFDVLNSPIRKYYDRGEGKISINIPVNISRPLHATIEKYTGDYLVVPEFTARSQQAFNTSIDVSSPMFGGSAFFAVRENAGLNVTGAIGNASIDLDTNDGKSGKARIKGELSLPLTFSMFWRTITFGFSMQPARFVRIGFQVHRHSFAASTAGNLKSSFLTRIEQTTLENVFSTDIPYSDKKIFARVDGAYQGQAWAPEIGIQVGPVGIVSRMGLDIEAEGYLESEYQVPFFIDEKDFSLKFTEVDSFLATENLRKMVNGEVVYNSYKIRDKLHIRVPQSHTFSLDFLKDRIFLSYTKTFGRLETFTDFQTAADDSGYFDTRDYLDASLETDHILILTTNIGWFRHSIGTCSFDVGYRGRSGIYSNLLKDFIDVGPFMPIWNFGFHFGTYTNFNMDFYIVPLPAVRSGFSYVF